MAPRSSALAPATQKDASATSVAVGLALGGDLRGRPQLSTGPWAAVLGCVTGFGFPSRPNCGCYLHLGPPKGELHPSVSVMELLSCGGDLEPLRVI